LGKLKRLIDDSKEIIDYYSLQFENDKDQAPLHKIKELMEQWSQIVIANNMSYSQLSLFSKLLKEPRECLWFEAGRHLAFYSSIDKTVNNIFLDLCTDSQSTTRFNIAALIPEIEKTTQQRIIEILLNDKSSKVRIKTIDSILRTKVSMYKKVLFERLKIEEDQKVIENIDFALANWGKY